MPDRETVAVGVADIIRTFNLSDPVYPPHFPYHASQPERIVNPDQVLILS